MFYVHKTITVQITESCVTNDSFRYQLLAYSNRKMPVTHCLLALYAAINLCPCIISKTCVKIKKNSAHRDKFCYNVFEFFKGGILMDQVMGIAQSIFQVIMTHVSMEILIYISIGILLLILIWIITRAIRQRKAERRINDLEVEINEIRNNSLAYKYNKASAFARSNNEVTQRVQNLQPKYEACIQSITTCDELFTEADDYLESHRSKKAMRSMDELEAMLDDTKERIRIVNQSLDNILKKEKEVREYANALKERFHGIKTAYQENRSSYYGASQYFDSRLQEIENEFSHFEEWMYASEFDKAKEEVEKTSTLVDEVSKMIASCPSLYEKAKTIIPQALQEVKNSLSSLDEEKVDLSYLEPENKLNQVDSMLSNVIVLLDAGSLEDAQEILEQASTIVLDLQDDIIMEKQAYEEIHGNLSNNLNVLDAVEEDLFEIKSLYTNIKDRFGLEDWTHRFALADEQLAELKQRRTYLKKELTVDKPSVEVVHEYRDFVQDTREFSSQIKEMKQMLVGASSDESRARKQLTKLQLILNEVRLSTLTHQLPSLSEQFDTDIKEGESLIQRVRVVLGHSPLDVQTLNADLQDAIDFVYKLYNNVNNLIGVAVMVENAIVFGNRFRSSHSDMDTELTRAELCFQNGEYTRALKIAIQAIENLHPGVYEKLVAKKDPAVMNQVQ